MLLSQVRADSKLYQFKHEEDIKIILMDYFNNVDKNVEGILDYLTSEFILHFGSSGVTRVKSKTEFYSIFALWSNSKKSDFSSTKINSINIQETHVVKNYTAVADVIYTRLNSNGRLFVRKDHYIILSEGQGIILIH